MVHREAETEATGALGGRRREDLPGLLVVIWTFFPAQGDISGAWGPEFAWKQISDTAILEISC